MADENKRRLPIGCVIAMVVFIFLALVPVCLIVGWIVAVEMDWIYIP